MPTVDINLWAVLVSAVIFMVLGALWYSALFQKPWMKEMGLDMKTITEAQKKGMGKNYALALLGAFVMCYVLAHFVDYAQADTAAEGMQAGFWAWLGFIAVYALDTVLWEGKSWKLWAINTSYRLIALLIAGAILATWA